MYNVSRQSHPKYGNVIEIKRVEIGSYHTPSMAYNAAEKSRRLWREEGAKKVRVLIDDQLLTIKQAESWSITEYKSLPKCAHCSAILNDDVFTHQLSREHLFCSQLCADADYRIQTDKLSDEYECDFR